MRQVVALIRVQCQAQTALNLAQVVAHVVWVLGQVYGLQRQPPQPLTAVNGLWVQCGQLTCCHSATRLLHIMHGEPSPWDTLKQALQINIALTSCCELATPPDPGLAPCSLADMKLIVPFSLKGAQPLLETLV